MLYPIATVSYPLTPVLGLPYGAPFSGAMQYYQTVYNYIQVSFVIPYAVPNGYAISIQLVDAIFQQGTAYANFQSLTYTPVYIYAASNTGLVISGMGPIVVGTTVTVTFLISITTTNLFTVSVYIDTLANINGPILTNYLYQGLAQKSGVVISAFFNNFYDSFFNAFTWRVMSSSSFVTGQWFTI
jgi:hypothetical protein